MEKEQEQGECEEVRWDAVCILDVGRVVRRLVRVERQNASLIHELQEIDRCSNSPSQIRLRRAGEYAEKSTYQLPQLPIATS